MQELTQPVLRASDEHFQRGMNGLLQTHFKLTATGARTYQGEILRSYVSPMLRLADIAFSPHFTCLKAGKQSPRNQSYLVSHQIEGWARVAQGGRTTEVGPNQIFFVDTSQPFEIETDTIRTRSVYLDTHFWRESFPERDQYTATVLGRDNRFSSVCREMIAQVFEMSWDVDDRAMRRMGACLANLLAVAMVSNPPAGGYMPSSERLSEIREVVLRHLADPDLDCAMVASEMGLSVRQVHAVFSASGTTLMRHVMAERLIRIARDLETPALSQKPVSSIAFDWGFNEAAHFSRRFKAQFGMSPTMYREVHLFRQAERMHALN